jgi:aspartate aminotransferase-like enzyme
MKLYTPGPVPVPDRIMQAVASPMIHHQSDEFRQVLSRTRANLQSIIGTDGIVALLAGSSMTAIDSVTAGLLRQGDVVLVLRHGRFGDRLTDCAAIHGARVESLSALWGETISPELFRTHLLGVLSRGPLRAVWMVHSETSTGVSLDVEALAGVLRQHAPETLLLVDGVTSVAVQKLHMDDWQIDAVVTGTQKGLMSPPGIGIVAMSQRLEEIVRATPTALYSNDLRKVLDAHDKGLMLWTPPVSIVRALDVACQMVLERGLERVWHHHDELHDYVTSEALRRGFTLFGNATSRALVAVTREGVSALRSELKRRCLMHVADGQDALAGKIMRIGICGSYTLEDMRDLFAAIDQIDLSTRGSEA